jgi:hypothetical protein
MAKKIELALVNAKDLQVIEYRGQRVATTEQLAAGYGTTTKNIQDNFQYNRQRFVEGKHYFLLKGAELLKFKNLHGNSGVVNKHTSQFILWTERGAANHSKMLETDQAWDYFNDLSEFYFTKHDALPAATNWLEDPAQLRSMLIGYTEKVEQITVERDEAVRTKGQISRKREAQALGKLGAVTRKCNVLSERLGESTKHATVTAVLNATGTEYKWAPLRKWCRVNNVEAKFVADERWGSVKSWPAEAWLAEYGVDLRKLFGGEA